MKISIVLICHNSANDIKPCLDSVLKACDSFDSEVLVVDNGSKDESISLLQTYKPAIRLLCNSSNQGVAKARNRAFIEAKGDFIWILDIDTLVNKKALEQMLQLCTDNPEIGLCGCKLTDFEGYVQKSCRKYPTLSYKIFNLLESFTGRYKYLTGLHLRIKKNNSKQFYQEKTNGHTPFEVDYVIGACQFFRRSLLEKVGYLDEAIFYGPEDADFCLRIHKSGLKVVYLPDISIIHHYNRISNKSPFSRISWLHIKGLFHFWWKNRKVLK